MRDKEILDLASAYKQICEEKVGILLSDEIIEGVDVYDEVLEYLLDEGYTKEESNQIMVELINEGGLASFLNAVKQRTGIGKPGVGPGQVAKNIVRAGISDVLGTSIGAGSAPSASSPVKAPTAKTQSPAPIVRTSTKTPRTSPKGANVAPDPWKSGTTGSRIKDVTQKPSAKPTTTRALSGTPSRASLPSGSRGGAIVRSTPGGALSTTPKPTSTPKPTPTPRALSGTPSRASLPSGSGGGSIVRSTATAKPTAQTPRASTPSAPRGGPIQKVSVKDITPTQSTRSLSPAKSDVRSQQFRDVQRLNKSTGGGLMGELPKTTAEKPAPKPAWKSGSKAADKLPPKPTQQAKSSVKPQKTPTSSAGRQGFSLPGIGGKLGAFGAGIQAYNTADATPKTAPKLPTSAKEVKKGQTYYDPSTRVGSSQRFSQRLKVGPKIVGTGKADTDAQSFDKAYGAAKAKSGMGSTFKWNGKDYKVS
jgi:hypothetical protein